jgi:hypothetical protein
MADLLPPLKPIPIKDRLSILYIEHGHLDVLDGAFVVVDKAGVHTHIPVGGVVCLMLEPGTRVSHAACALSARVGTLLVWLGEAGVRLYSAGQPGGARSDNDPNILHQSQDGAIALGRIALPHGRARIETSCHAKTCSRPWRKTPNRPCDFSNCRSTGWSSQVGRSRFSPNPLGGST